MKESEKKDEPLDLVRELEKKTKKKTTVEHESGGVNCNRCSWYNNQTNGTRTGNKRTSGDHPNYRIVEIGQNTEKSPDNLRRFTVTQTPMRNHRLTLV